MKRLLLLVAAVVAVPSAGFATVDAWLDVSTPVRSIQTSGHCLRKHTMLAEYGIPMVNVMMALLHPAWVYDAHTGSHSDMNEVTAGLQTLPTGTYHNDSFDERTGIQSYEMQLDMSAVNTANGQSPEGRFDTIRRAKLYLLALADNFHVMSNGKFRLRVSFVGLPSQTGLAGTRLNATTVSPYSATSPLLVAYRNELIAPASECH